MKLLGVSRMLLLASIATMFIKTWSIPGTPFKPSEILLGLSAALAALGIYHREALLSPRIRNILASSVIMFCILAVGSVAGLIAGPHAPDLATTAVSYGRFAACVLAFALTLFFAERDGRFAKDALLAYLPSLGIIPFAYLVPAVSENGLLLDPSALRFAGLFTDPNYFANFAIVPIMILVGLMRHEKRMAARIGCFAVVSLAAGLFAWSGSRSGWLGLAAASAILIASDAFSRRYVLAAVTAIALAASAAIGVAILPEQGQRDVAARTELIVSKGPENETTVIASVAKGQSRSSLWKQSVSYAAKNPLGYGPGYSKVLGLEEPGKNHAVAHNIVLETLLIGGIPLLAFFSWHAWKNRELFRRHPYPILVAAGAGMLVSALFIDSLESRWIWIFAAILIATRSLPARTLPIR